VETLRIIESKKDLTWEYDAEADVLYLSVGQPKKAEGIDIGEGTVVRVDPETQEVVGITLIGIRERMLSETRQRKKKQKKKK